jgi:hypothetical protein
LILDLWKALVCLEREKESSTKFLYLVNYFANIAAAITRRTYHERVKALENTAAIALCQRDFGTKYLEVTCGEDGEEE